MVTITTRGIIQKANPAKWSEHHYGLSLERWNSLQNKSFWITGAGTGYGRSMAVALASANADIFLTGRRREKLQETLEEMKSLNIPTRNCHIIEADITDIEQMMRACNKVKSLCSSLYGLVNNAALPSKEGILYPLHDESLEYWEKMMRLNVRAPWLLTRTIFPYMKHGGVVRVLFITSEAGWASTSGLVCTIYQRQP